MNTKFWEATERIVRDTVKLREKLAKVHVMNQWQKAVTEQVHLKQVAALEYDLEDTLETFFIRQVKSAAKALGNISEPAQKSAITTINARALAEQIFTPKDWDEELINRAFPVMANAMIGAAKAQIKMIAFGAGKLHRLHTKASTATQYLQGLTDEDLYELEFLLPVGVEAAEVSYYLQTATEFPEWMKKAIERHLQDSFKQAYWTKVNQTTLGDIESYLTNGIKDGWSIERMAKSMASNLLEEGHYALVRGRRIARTESGHALNGARSMAIDDVIQSEDDLSPYMKKVWLSVLGTTTRLTHADLDGVPADKEGMWLLGGVRIPWPGHISLPAGERINCQCTIVTEMGLQDHQAQQLIDEYMVRYEEQSKAYKVKNCGIGPGGFQPGNTCAKGGTGASVQDASGLYEPSQVGHASGVNKKVKKWDKQNKKNQWALKKINKMEKLAEEGKWDEFHKSMSKPKYPYNKLTKQQKAIVDAQNTLLSKHGTATAKKISEDAKPIKAEAPAWKKIGGQLGTEKGGVYEFDGKKYYVKQPDDVNRAMNEFLAFKLYEAAGGSVADVKMIELDGKPAFASEWLEGSEKPKWTKGDKVLAGEDFALHAWLNNRDAVGAGSENPMDNIKITADGQLKLIDAGGALDYKGMGGSGKKDFGTEADEYYGLRDPKINPTMASVFGGMTAKQLHASAQKLNNISNDDIVKLVDKVHPGTPSEKAAMTAKLVSRKAKILFYAENGMKAQKALIAELAAAISPDPKLTSPNPKPKPNVTHKIAIPKEVVAEAKKAAGSSPPSVPPPPAMNATKSTQSHINKLKKIHEAAQKGDLAAVEKVKTNPNVKHSYNQKVHAYKVEVMAAMAAGGKVSKDHVVPKPIAAKPKKIVIDANKFPVKPEFVSKIQANVEQNNKLVETALTHAKEGDIGSLKEMSLPPSPKLKQWHADLVSNLSHQLNPPPPPKPPKPLSQSYKELSDLAPPPTGSLPSSKKSGYWNIAHEFDGIPMDAPKTVKRTADQKKALNAEGVKIAKESGVSDIIHSYTGSGSGSMNGALREWGAGGSYYASNQQNAVSLAKTIIKKGTNLDVGTNLWRCHESSLAELSKLRPGQVVADKGMLSTAVDYPAMRGRSVWWKMTAGEGVKGISAVDMSSHNEREMILASNQRIIITKITKDWIPSQNGFKKTYEHDQPKTYIEAVVMPTVDSQCCPP